MTILSILNEIAATSSKLEKQAILQRNVNDVTLQKVFVAAYDPTIKYYIKKIPDYTCLSEVGHTANTLDQAISSLFLKLASRAITGGEAIKFLQSILNQLSTDDAIVLERVIKRDLRVNCSESTANKVWKGLIQEFPYMRCALPKDAKLDQWLWKHGIYSQIKADGMFCNLDMFADGEVGMTSRSGSEFDIAKFPKIVADAQHTFPVGNRVNGELRVYRDGKVLPREISNGILNSILKGGDWENPNDEVFYDAWDIIPLEAAVSGGKYGIPYETRFTELTTVIECASVRNIRLITTKIVYSLAEAYEHYFELIAAGEEGSIIKTKSGIWKDTTSKDQVKLKVTFECDLKIKGITQGTGKNASTFGSVSCATLDELLEVDVPGFDDKTRAELYQQYLDGTLVDGIMTTKANGIMPPTASNGNKYSLFSPRFAEIRLDKSEADTYARVREQYDAVLDTIKQMKK